MSNSLTGYNVDFSIGGKFIKVSRRNIDASNTPIPATRKICVSGKLSPLFDTAFNDPNSQKTPARLTFSDMRLEGLIAINSDRTFTMDAPKIMKAVTAISKSKQSRPVRYWAEITNKGIK